MEEEAERRHTLCQLLARNREEFDIEYGGYLSNHMSHYLVALFKLGASPERLQKAYADYSTETKLEPAIPATFVISTDTWQNFIGKKTHYLNLFKFFQGELEQHGVRLTLRKYVPQLLEGVCGSAFHGVIQLGYALEVMDVPNIAEGLAYWTYSFYSLGTPSSVEKRPRQASAPAAPAPALRTADVIALLDRLRLDTRFDAVFTEPERKKLGFQKRLHLLAAEYLPDIAPYDLDFAPFIMAGEPGASTTRWDRIEALIDLFTLSAIKVFASSGYLYFFVLHLVTSFRALKVTLRTMCMDGNEEDDDDNAKQKDVSEEEALLVATALEFFWRAVVCAYIAVDRPTVSDIDPQALKRDEAEATASPQEQASGASSKLPAAFTGWDDVVQAAIPNHDEHLVKLVFVCWIEAHEPEARKRGPEWNEYFLHAAANTVLRFHHNWLH